MVHCHLFLPTPGHPSSSLPLHRHAAATAAIPLVPQRRNAATAATAAQGGIGRGASSATELGPFHVAQQRRFHRRRQGLEGVIALVVDFWLDPRRSEENVGMTRWCFFFQWLKSWKNIGVLGLSWFLGGVMQFWCCWQPMLRAPRTYGFLDGDCQTHWSSSLGKYRSWKLPKGK